MEIVQSEALQQNFVKEAEKELWRAWRNFVEVDCPSAFDVGDLKKGARSLEVTNAKVRRGAPRGVNQGKVPRN